MNYPFFLARRLSLATNGRKNSPAVTVAIIAVSVSVAVMVAAIAIVLGFKEEIRNKVIGFNGHITIYKIPINEEDDNLITLTPQLCASLDSLSFVTNYSLAAALPAVFKTKEDFKGIYLKGIGGSAISTYLSNNLEEGIVSDFESSTDSLKNKILISRQTANNLLLNIGDKIDTYFMSDDIRVRRLEIGGIYNTHFDQYDNILAFGNINLVSQMGNIPENTGTYIIVYTDNFDKIDEYTFLLQDALNKSALKGESDDWYRTDNVLSQGRGFFSWLSLLDMNVIVIIILMMIVGCVTLVSGMLIIILERKKFIGLMRAMGAPAKKIRNVFIFMAIKISLFGILIGNLVVLTFLGLQHKYHFIKLDADSYYIDYMPVSISIWMIIFLNLGVLLITYLVLVLPARFVGKISPAESIIRNE